VDEVAAVRTVDRDDRIAHDVEIAVHIDGDPAVDPHRGAILCGERAQRLQPVFVKNEVLERGQMVAGDGSVEEADRTVLGTACSGRRGGSRKAGEPGVGLVVGGHAPPAAMSAHAETRAAVGGELARPGQ
jgi:hypothetical protein